MKAKYIAPQTELMEALSCSIIAASTVSITLSDEAFSGEGRVKDDSSWGDIWGNNEE